MIYNRLQKTTKQIHCYDDERAAARTTATHSRVSSLNFEICVTIEGGCGPLFVSTDRQWTRGGRQTGCAWFESATMCGVVASPDSVTNEGATMRAGLKEWTKQQQQSMMTRYVQRAHTCAPSTRQTFIISSRSLPHTVASRIHFPFVVTVGWFCWRLPCVSHWLTPRR